MDSQIDQVGADCKTCENVRNRPPKVKGAKWPTPSEPWYRVHVDFAGPINGKMLFILVDASTKWVEVSCMKKTTTSRTIQELRKIFCNQGLPVELVSDNGPQFTSREFKEFMGRNGVRHIRGAPYHPETNGLAERMVQVVKRALKKQPKTDMEDGISRFLLSYRNTPHSTTGKSPAMMLQGRKLRCKLDLLHPPVETEKSPEEGRVKIGRKLEIGEIVLARDFRPGGTWRRGIIVKKFGKFLYSVKTEEGYVKRHIDQLLGNQNRMPEEGWMASQLSLPDQTEPLEVEQPLMLPESETVPEPETEPEPELNIPQDPTREIEPQEELLENRYRPKRQVKAPRYLENYVLK